MHAFRLLLAAAVIAPAATWATPNFPASIARDLQLSGSPACTVCHATNDGGAGTVVKPFGKYLVSRGLVPFDEGSLAGALAAAAGERHDSDGDGLDDIDALKQGLDPNGSSTHASTLEDPSFGCSAAGAGAGPSILLAAAGVLLTASLRRRPARVPGRPGRPARASERPRW